MMTDKVQINQIRDLYWDKEYSIQQVAEKLDLPFWALYNFIHKHKMPLRSSSETTFIANKAKPQFKLKEDLTIADEKLKIAGAMLYWAEGTLMGNTVDFVNSNPEMVRTFLKFLREICGVDERRLRVYLYAYSYQDIAVLKSYWHKVTKISLRQFTKPYIRKGNLNLSSRKLLYGLVHIRYNDKRLLAFITNWISEYVIRAGTQVAKGDRLSKGSVLLKSKMEK